MVTKNNTIRPKIPSSSERPGLQKDLAVTDAAFELFGYMPRDGDMRWGFLENYSWVKEQVGFTPQHFANARRATYLSNEESHIEGFVTTAAPKNMLQGNRALDNIVTHDRLDDLFELTKRKGDPTVVFRITDRLTTDPAEAYNPITPCPEALHQLQLFDDEGYLARVGINAHYEDDVMVISIANIQGVPGGVNRNRGFCDQYGKMPFNFLVERVKSISNASPINTETRGVINPSGGNSRLYQSVFSATEIPMFHRPHSK